MCEPAFTQSYSIRSGLFEDASSQSYQPAHAKDQNPAYDHVAHIAHELTILGKEPGTWMQASRHLHDLKHMHAAG